MLLHFLSLLRPLYEGDGGGGTGNTGGDPKDDARAPRASDILERHGSDAIKLAERLATREGDNYALREERRQLKEQLTQLQGKLPAADAVVLSKDDAATIEAYRALGKPDELKTALTERQTTQQELASLRQDLALRDVAAAAKYDVDVLRTIGGDLTYTIKDEQVNGKAERKVYVKVKEGDAEKEQLLADYAKAQWAKFMPSLQLANTTQQRAIGTPRTGPGGAPLATTPPAETARDRRVRF